MKSLRVSALALLLGLPVSTAWAQETTAPAADPAAAAAPAPAAAPAAVNADGLAPDAASAEVGQAYAAATNGDWKSRCFKAEDGSDPCEMFQVLSDGVITADGKLNTVGEISFFDIPDEGEAVAGAALILPLETDLQSGIVITIDTGKPKIYPYSFCTLSGCVARLGFTAGDIEEFKRGGKAVLIVVPAAAPDKKVEVPISLKGFTAGFEALPKAPAP